MSNVTTYLFHPTTREFVEEYSAQRSPLAPDELIVTEHHCLDAPPVVGVNEAAVRNAENTAWVVTPDFRSAVVYDAVGGEVKVSTLGQLPPGLSLISPPPTQAEQLKAIERRFEKHMDEVAQADGWDNRWTCAARAGYANPWQSKAIKFAQWMDACWMVAIQAQNDVVAGLRTIPTPDEAVLELPVMVW